MTEHEHDSREVPVAWEALEDAFENNAPEVHSFLNLKSGEVIRVVDGVADPSMHVKLVDDPAYLRVDAVSSREQYRWMERFIVHVEDPELRQRLVAGVDGKGAFRHFPDVLLPYPLEREQRFTFRSERLKACMDSWLEAHEIKAVDRPTWDVPPAPAPPPEPERPARRGRAAQVEGQKHLLHELIEQLPNRELDTAIAFLEFLRDRRRLPRFRAKPVDGQSGDEHGVDEHGVDEHGEATDHSDEHSVDVDHEDR